jgi:hypothetical protein
MLGAVFGPTSRGETAYATTLTARLRTDMLLLADRAFDGNEFLATVAGTGAHFLIRTRHSRRPPVLAALPDGSYLTRVAGLRLRVIDADVTMTTEDDHRVSNRNRLLTTLLDHRSDPAGRLVRLYHERWGATRSRTSLSELPEGGRQLLLSTA